MATRDQIASLADSLSKEGARSIVLTGSHARGDAHADSDVDLIALHTAGKAHPAYLLRRYDESLVSISWRTAGEVRHDFADPGAAGMAVAAWRDSILLHDSDGTAALLKNEAMSWRWENLGDQPDHWVAEQLTGYAEEVHKLRAALEGRRGAGNTDEETHHRLAPHLLAVERNVLAMRLAWVLAVHHRFLIPTENYLWHMVSEREGSDWRNAQAQALAEGGESLERSSEAALRMYALAAAHVRSTLAPCQREVVDAAIRLCEPTFHPVPGRSVDP